MPVTRGLILELTKKKKAHSEVIFIFCLQNIPRALPSLALLKLVRDICWAHPVKPRLQIILPCRLCSQHRLFIHWNIYENIIKSSVYQKGPNIQVLNISDPGSHRHQCCRCLNTSEDLDSIDFGSNYITLDKNIKPWDFLGKESNIRISQRMLKIKLNCAFYRIYTELESLTRV